METASIAFSKASFVYNRKVNMLSQGPTLCYVASLISCVWSREFISLSQVKLWFYKDLHAHSHIKQNQLLISNREVMIVLPAESINCSQLASYANSFSVFRILQ